MKFGRWLVSDMRQTVQLSYVQPLCRRGADDGTYSPWWSAGVKETIHIPNSVMDRVYLRQNLTMALAWSAYWPGYNMWINVVQARAHVPRMTRRWATQDRMKTSTSPISSRTGMYLRQNLTTALVWSAYTGQGTTCGLMSCRARVHVPGMARRWANLKSNISSYVRHYALPC